MTIYLDMDFKCHVENDGTMLAIETEIFDGKCRAFIEGYRYVPEGKTWTRWDGVVFTGEMIVPYQPYEHLAEAQKLYEEAMAEVQAQLEDMKSALEILGVTVDE